MVTRFPRNPSCSTSVGGAGDRPDRRRSPAYFFASQKIALRGRFSGLEKSSEALKSAADGLKLPDSSTVAS